MLRKLSLGLAAGAVAMVTAAAPALAAPQQITGAFYYVDLLGGADQINNPTPGTCYAMTSAAVSGFNGTNAEATVYTDKACTLGGVRTAPNSSVNQTLFGSVRFSTVN